MAKCMASLLECPICLDPFTDPRMLGCLHTLCYKCLRDLIATTGQRGQFDCPSCRKPQQTPPGGAEKFQKNFFVNTYMDTVKKTEGATPRKGDPRNHPCNNSEDGDECPQAEQFCTDCCEYYCKTCSKGHRRSNISRGHVQVSLDDVTEEMIREARAKSETPRCPKHKDKKLELYCNSCQCAVCSVCCHISHQSHTFKEMADVDVELNAELEVHIAQLQSLSDGVEQQSKRSKHSQEKLEASISKARKITEESFQKAIQMLHQKAKEFDQSLQKMAEDGQVKVAAQNKNLTLHGDLIESLQDFADNLLNRGTVYNKLASLQQIRNRMQELETSPPQECGRPTMTDSPSYVDTVAEKMDGLVMQGKVKMVGTEPQQDIEFKITYCIPKVTTERSTTSGFLEGYMESIRSIVPMRHQVLLNRGSPSGRRSYTAESRSTRNIPGTKNSRRTAADLELSEEDMDDTGSPGDDDEVDKCAICLEVMRHPKKLEKCGHIFCRGCIDKNAGKHEQKKCPTCGMVYRKLRGDQPKRGSMRADTQRNLRLPGHEDVPTYVITFTFPSGKQGPDHPNPGTYYRGTTRVAYLPANETGRKVLKLIKTAFEAGLMFTIGQSRTTGHEGVITYNDIHMKTSIDGGPTRFGYPDPTYLDRVREELAAKGITE